FGSEKKRQVFQFHVAHSALSRQARIPILATVRLFLRWWIRVVTAIDVSPWASALLRIQGCPKPLFDEKQEFY
ncbi:MAG: hypothetical protein ACOYM3_31835, partial [Terrimicrobiaceae bacterium]